MVSWPRLRSVESNIQAHHDTKADHAEPGGQFAVAVWGRFGHQVLEHDVEHGTSCERQGIGKEWLGEADANGAQYAGYGLDHAAQLAVPKASPVAETGGVERQADGKAFGKVLNSDAKSQVPKKKK